MNSSLIYQIGRFGVPSSAGLYQPNGNFLQVFPDKRVYKDKTAWLTAWYIFGDEMLTIYTPRSELAGTRSSTNK